MEQDRAWVSTALAAQLGRRILSFTDLDAAMMATVESAAETAPADAASITLRDRGRYRTAVSTDPSIEKADQLQYELDEGPCLDATADSEHYLVQDLGDDPRWPNWGPRAAELGLSSLLAVHVVVSDKTVGALNLYNHQPRSYDADDIYVAYLLAEQIGSALAAVAKIEHLSIGMTQRTVVGQAQGILMQRYDLDAQRAWSTLVRISQNSNTKVRDLAEQIIRTRQLPDLDS